MESGFCLEPKEYPGDGGTGGIVLNIGASGGSSVIDEALRDHEKELVRGGCTVAIEASAGDTFLMNTIRM